MSKDQSFILARRCNIAGDCLRYYKTIREQRKVLQEPLLGFQTYRRVIPISVTWLDDRKL